MSSPTPRLARARRGATAILVLTLTLTPITALAAPLGVEAGPRSVMITALDLLGAWWQVIADAFGGSDQSASDDAARGARSVAEKCGPGIDPFGGR